MRNLLPRRFLGGQFIIDLDRGQFEYSFQNHQQNAIRRISYLRSRCTSGIGGGNIRMAILFHEDPLGLHNSTGTQKMEGWRICNLRMVKVVQAALLTNAPSVSTLEFIHRNLSLRDQRGHPACHALIAAPANFGLDALVVDRHFIFYG